jgi:teichuronic acid exporter
MSMEKAARAGAWSALDIVLRQGVQFVVSIVLARILAPADFGLIALLTFFTSLSVTFVQGGLTEALVRHQDSTHEEESAVFWCNLAAATVFVAILLPLAPRLARFYEQPLLAPLLYIASAQIVLSALGAVQTALLSRTLRFDQLTKVGIVASLVSGAAAVAAAMMNLGVWALAIQLVTLAAVSTAVLWWITEWRPALRFRLSSIGHLYHFGFFLSLSSVLDVLYGSGFALVIGKVYGVRDLGLLNRASAIQALPTGIISTIITRTALPLFAARANDPGALRRGMKMALSLAMLLSLPMMVGLALLSDLVIVTLFGQKWLPAAPLLAIIAVGGAMIPLHVFNLQVLLAQGNSRSFLSLELQKKVIGIACLCIGSFFGIVGFAYSSIVAHLFGLAINARPTKKSLNYGIMAQVWDLRDILAANMFMVLVVLLLRWNTAFAPTLELLILSAAGAAAYAGFGLILRLPSFTEAHNIARLLLNNRGQAEPTAVQAVLPDEGSALEAP